MKAVEIISVPVSDQQKAKEFYLKMGLKLIVESEFDEKQKWIQLAFPGGGATLTLVTWFEQMSVGSLRGMVIACDDLEKDLQQLHANGIETAAPNKTPWGTFVTVKDPDGNSWSLHGK